MRANHDIKSDVHLNYFDFYRKLVYFKINTSLRSIELERGEYSGLYLCLLLMCVKGHKNIICDLNNLYSLTISIIK